jgi:glycosyltransferase involved in cell wall biosynthesis
MPVAVLEAMGAGLPVVATSVGDVPRVVADGTGIIVPPGSPADLSSALRLLLNDPQRACALGDAARCHVAEHYGVDAWVNQLLAIYERAIGGDARGTDPVSRPFPKAQRS